MQMEILQVIFTYNLGLQLLKNEPNAKIALSHFNNRLSQPIICQTSKVEFTSHPYSFGF